MRAPPSIRRAGPGARPVLNALSGEPITRHKGRYTLLPRLEALTGPAADDPGGG